MSEKDKYTFETLIATAGRRRKGDVGWDSGIPEMLRAVAALLDASIASREGRSRVPPPTVSDVMRELRGRGDPALVRAVLASLFTPAQS